MDRGRLQDDAVRDSPARKRDDEEGERREMTADKRAASGATGAAQDSGNRSTPSIGPVTPGVKHADATDEDMQNAVEIWQLRQRGLHCDSCNLPVTVTDGVVEFDDEHAWLIHESCSAPELSLLSMDLGMLLSESSRFFDPIYPPLREIALRLDRVQEALAAARPFPFCYYIPPTGRVFDMQAEPGAQEKP